MLNVYKGISDAFEYGLYCGIKLLDHVMKVSKRVIEMKISRKGNVDRIQSGFVRVKGTTVVIFIVKEMKEKYLEIVIDRSMCSTARDIKICKFGGMDYRGH